MGKRQRTSYCQFAIAVGRLHSRSGRFLQKKAQRSEATVVSSHVQRNGMSEVKINMIIIIMNNMDIARREKKSINKLILQITFCNQAGKFDIDVTTFQMAVLFAWNQRPLEKITYENLRLATELPDPELRRTLWSLCAFPKIKRQLILIDPSAQSPKDFSNATKFWVNQEFAIM